MTKEVPKEKYVKLTHHEHILKLPDTYIGSVKADNLMMWIVDDEGKFIHKEITYVPGLYKIYDEILVNAHDHSVRDPTCKTIKVNISKKTGKVTVWNDGNGIDVSINKKENMFNPELIFGNLLTSSNYDQKGKTWGGKNGYGAKLANIYSTDFYVTTVDTIHMKKYHQHFYDNMYKKDKAEITNVSEDVKPYTKISFIPDFKRFGLEGFTDDIIGLFKKRAYDISACDYKHVKVYLNDELINIKSFGDYIKLHYPEIDGKQTQMTYKEINEYWKLGVVYTPESGFSHISHVNGIWTYSQDGGTHVQHALAQIIDGLLKYIKIKYKDVNVRPSYLKDNMTLFVDCTTTDPNFTSQTKECLKISVSDFIKKCSVDENFIASIAKLDIVNDAVELAKSKDSAVLKKTDGKKTKRVNVPKLYDAVYAGTGKSNDCRLIITEGDSAQSFAIDGLNVIGRELYGVFPIRGKMLNVRDAPYKKILQNKEIENIKRVMGLQQNVVYTKDNIKKLRYGGILVLTDADVDGSHIKGLVMNFIQTFWPELMAFKGFFQTISTPIIKVTKKSAESKKKISQNDQKIFYTLSDYEKWVIENQTVMHQWNVKYYKGLGTSKSKEACEAFEDFDKKLLSYVWEFNSSNVDINMDTKSVVKSEMKSDTEKSIKSSGTIKKVIKKKDDVSDKIIEYRSQFKSGKSYDSIMLAFSKDFADRRKKWLGNYNKNDIIDAKNLEIPFSDFINKDLKHFSNYDNERSIPSLCDGLKPSQRKILFTVIDKKYDSKAKEQKVQGLGSSVQKRTSYIHGETSLFEAITKMAQNFVDSNNINLLYPSGNFGSRRLGGDDSANARYIFTYLESIAKLIFRKEDEPIYKYKEEENILVEPETFAPIIPMILINGAHGIGTGYSTEVPCYNIKDVISNIISLIKDKSMDDMIPWYKGFKGTITPQNDTTFISHGVYEIIDEYTLKITELPIGMWIQKYDDFIKSILTSTKSDKDKTTNEQKHCIVDDYYNLSGNNSIDFTLIFSGHALQNMIKTGTLEKQLKLCSSISISDMHLHNVSGGIMKYDCPEDILSDFYDYRLEMYEKRRNYYVKYLQNELNIIKYKIKFIKYVIKKKIVLHDKNTKAVIEELVKYEFPKLSKDINAIDIADLVSDIDDDKEEKVVTRKTYKTYNYITDLGLFTMTKDKMEILEKQREDKQCELTQYLEMTSKDIWLKELNELSEAYDSWLKESLDEMYDIKSNKKKVGKKRISKSKKTK